MSQALTLSDISYSVAGLDILRQLSLDVAVEQYYAIAGVNGAGKSTLIKLVLDLIRPRPGGSISIFGLDNTNPKCRDQLVYLPEKFDVKKISAVDNTSTSSPPYISGKLSIPALSILPSVSISPRIASIHMSVVIPRGWCRNSDC